MAKKTLFGKILLKINRVIIAEKPIYGQSADLFHKYTLFLNWAQPKGVLVGFNVTVGK